MRKQLYNILLAKYMFRPMEMLRDGEQADGRYIYTCSTVDLFS
jgi:hypothetical protein